MISTPPTPMSAVPVSTLLVRYGKSSSEFIVSFYIRVLVADAYPRLTIFLIEVIVGRLIDSTTCSSLVYSGIKGLDMLEGDL